VPWDDLRYIFGEIMYGGHIVEDWDRRLASAYLLKYFTESLLEGFEMFPGFATPPTGASHKQVRGGGLLRAWRRRLPPASSAPLRQPGSDSPAAPASRSGRQPAPAARRRRRRCWSTSRR
jgi:hypothetical protein